MKRIITLSFVLALLVRVYSVFPYNTVIGFDQARDLFDSYTMIQSKDLRFIGPTAGNNAALHHGIGYIYYLAIPLAIFGPNPMNAVYFNIMIQSTLVLILSYFSWELFKSKQTTISVAILTAFSYALTQFSGWLSNPTITLVTVPLLYLSLWKYPKNNWWLVLTALSLGLSIQFELFFLYLIPVFLVYALATRPKLASIKTLFVSALVFLASVSTMIMTEIKFSFTGVMAILGAGDHVGQNLSMSERIDFFISRFSSEAGMSILQNISLVFILIFATIIVLNFINKIERKAVVFLCGYIASPAIMLILGAHNAPWFLIGVPPAIILLYSYLLSKLRLVGYIGLVVLVSVNFFMISKSVDNGQVLLEPDQGAILSKQLAAINYTYNASNNEPFAIDTVTNPLYINAVWGFHYMWYGQSKYGYMPTWLGGNQLAPYNTLSNSVKSEKYYFVIVDDTARIPDNYRRNAIDSMNEFASHTKTNAIEGITVHSFIKN